MKKGFTLVEMLIVVVVLVTLMSITFKLSSIGDDQTHKNTTVARMQRLENCLSGYYAAFGTYPPVRLHGSRDYNLPVNSHGMQQLDGSPRVLSLNWHTETGAHGIGSDAERRDWQQVKAACMSQPVAARFPYPAGYNEMLIARSELAKERLASGEDTDTSIEHKNIVNAGYDDGYTSNPGRHELSEPDWTESQLFQFGVMSFLLPRYLVMMNGAQEFFSSGAQWRANNTIPSDPLDGSYFNSWNDVKMAADNARSGDKRAKARIANIPSQAVCARWMPNLEGTCYCGLNNDIFGIDIRNVDAKLYGTSSIFAPGGSQSGSTSQQYALNVITITDGWGHEFYYYSPPPYQSYTVWSGGPNDRTFPPWVSRGEFTGAENKCIGVWVNDDIVHMSN